MRHQLFRILALLALALLTTLCLRSLDAFSTPKVLHAHTRQGSRTETLVPRAAAEPEEKGEQTLSFLEQLPNQKKSEGEGMSLETGYYRAGWGAALLAAPKLLAVGKGGFLGTAKAELAALQMAQVLVVVVIVLKVMRSAAARGRLNGTTFKQLNLALIGAFATIFGISLYELAGLAFKAVSKGGALSALIGPIALTVLALWTSWLAVSTAYKALEEHGLPSFRCGVVAKEGALFSALAIAYAVTALHSAWWGFILTLYSPLKMFGALRCFVVAACAYECQKAAVAGRTQCSALGGKTSPAQPRRLASETYRQLNVALIVDSICRLYALRTLGSGLSFFVLPGLALATSSIGWLTGKTSVGK